MNPAVRPGKFVVKGTHLLADELVGRQKEGWSDDKLLQTHPERTKLRAAQFDAGTPGPEIDLFNAAAQGIVALSLGSFRLDANWVGIEHIIWRRVT